MEFHIPKSSDSPCFPDSFTFSPQELADIPCPDDICTQGEGSSQDDDNELLLPPGTTIDDFPDLPLPPGTSGDEFPELPLPPGTSGDEFPIPLPPGPQPFLSSNNFSPSLPNKALESSSNLLHPESENLHTLPFGEDSQQKHDIKSGEIHEDALSRQAEFLDESKNSPTKMDSDEENQDSTVAKPKVLGKEQAKKRLMAFSLSKQPNTSIKKQSKAVTPAKNKEKPPNPNKGTNVQDQFRATISAIEEEKKKMFQNMPSYLLLEMSELAKSSHSSMSSSIQLLEKLRSESTDLKSKETSGKSGSTTAPEGKRKRSFHKSRSRSKEKKPRRSRSKRRSRSRTKRSHSRSRRRSYSRGHSRRSRDKNYKADKNPRESQSVSKKKSFEDWKSFKAAGSILEANESEAPKTRPDESKSRRDKLHKRSRSPSDRPDFKPIFNYLNKGCNQMTTLQAKPAEPGSSSPVFLEKTIKYTRTKPILCWAENPSRATEFYMSRQMLLENCDETTSPFLLSIIENKNSISLEGGPISDSLSSKTRLWYPREGLLSTSVKARGDLEVNDSQPVKQGANTGDFTSKGQPNDEDSSGSKGSQKGKISLERKISLVNDSYLSDEEEQINEMTVGETKGQVDVNRVKVRSRWDSDYEGENNEKDPLIHNYRKREEIGTKMEVETTSQAGDKLIDDFDVAPRHESEHDSFGTKNLTALDNLRQPHAELPSANTTDETAGNLVSEYEQFLKMVSVDSSDDRSNQTEKVMLESKPKTDKSKARKSDKFDEEDRKIQSSKLGTTDWDQESDHEQKSISKKMQFSGTGSHDEFLILTKNESADVTLEKTKKKSSKKKTEKLKSEKKKSLKKSSKAKKKKFEDSFSEDDSSSESYDSDSDSDSDGSASSKKKKKKKVSKAKKKSKKGSPSESESDTGESKAKKKKQTKKKGKKRKGSSSDDNDDVQKALLKQLDFKKQLIMKKIEEIDSISDKSSKKKEKDSRGKKKEKESPEETDLEKHIKSGKKKKVEAKVEKDKKKSKYSVKKGKVGGKRKKLKKSKSSSDSYSDSESSDDNRKKKKVKKASKRKRYTSGSSDSEEKSVKGKSKSSNKASKKKKAKRESSSSGSEDSDDSSRHRKVKKGNKIKSSDEKSGKVTELAFKEKLLLDDPNAKSEERSTWESQKEWKKPEEKNKTGKDDDDWETSSSAEQSEQEPRTRESSWDEEFEAREAKPPPSEDSPKKADGRKTPVAPEKELTGNNSTDPCEPNNQLSSEALKTSLSNFSFNENSFCSFGQELSRDFFLADRSYSNSGNISGSESFRTTLIEPRPFQSVTKDSIVKRPPDSERYSPGYSDSDLSETEMSKCEKPNSNTESVVKQDVYDPLNCDSEGSAENNAVELSSIPLPRVPDILLPAEAKKFENVVAASSSTSDGSALKDIPHTGIDISDSRLSCMTPPVKSSFTASDFTPVAASQSPFTEETNTPTKRQLMSVKGQQKLISKAASVFQDESDEENVEPVNSKEKISETIQSEAPVALKEKTVDENKKKKEEKHSRRDEKEKDVGKKRKKESRDRSRERSKERESRRKRSRSRENRDNSKSYGKKASSPRRRKSRTPEVGREKREIRSDSFEIEPLKGALESNEVIDMVQPIPVLTGLEASSSEGLWSRSLVPSCEFPHSTDNLIDHAESFDIYPSEESNFRNRNYDNDYAEHEKSSVDKPRDQKSKKERRKSRSRSYSPRKKHRSKSPERRKSPRNRSPRRKSVSPKRRDKSPFSPRRRSPKRKSPSRRYKISRSPEKRRKSPSPRKRRGSPSRRSRSASPRKYRSPKHRDESPRKKDSPGRSFGSRDRFSPRDDIRYGQSYPDGLQNRIPVIGATSDDIDMELSPSAMRPPFEGSMGFSRHLPDSSITEPEMYGSFYEGEYADEFGVSNYSEEVGVNNLITVKNHDIEKTNSPERLSLDQRIELELGVQMSGSQAPSDQYQMPSQVCPPFQEMNSNHFQNSYNCENTNVNNDNFYQNQNVQMNTDFNGQYFNGHQQQPPPAYGSFQQYPNSQSSQNSVLQVGNIVEVVPTLQHPPPPPPLPPKAPQIMQVGNVLQVVPTQKATVPVPSAHNYGPDASPMVKTQKATAVVAPSSIVPTPNPEAVLNPLIKAIQLEREKRRKEKEKRKAEREARRKARQARREAKLMSVNEKLKKSVQNEGLMLGQEVEDDELLDGLDVPSPPIPVEIITVSSISALPPAGKGILITAGFMPKPPSEKKEVKFADGVCPGEGTSTSGGEDIASPPPKPKLPKEKRFKKKKTKVKKKVKVQIIRQIIQEDDDDEDDLSPPPPPPGDPPLVFFAKFPFAGDAQFPVYQTQTTTTTLTTVQYPAQTFE